MIPMLVVIKVRAPEHRRFRLYIPLVLVWLIQLPFVLILSPFAALYCLIRRVNLFRTAGAALSLLGAPRGTHIEVQDGESSFLVRIV